MAVLGSECRWSHKGSVPVPPGGQGKTRPSLQRIPPAPLARLLLAQLRHAASGGMRITESNPAWRAQEVTVDSSLHASSFLVKAPRPSAEPGSGPQVQSGLGFRPAPSWAAVQAPSPFAHAHSLASLPNEARMGRQGLGDSLQRLP